ncbi:MAG: SprT-like domain-containing protein [Acidobacteria bacterium]|nr:SprT-like domain-containing protein [Acidobacteriota bacterium]
MIAGESLLKMHFAEAFRQITKRTDLPEIHIAFYKFAGLNHTIRIRNQRVYVRLSEIIRDAPSQVHRALAFILVGKLFNKRIGTEYQNLYRQYAYHPDIQRKSDLAKQERGRKFVSGAIGRAFNLDQIFARLNRRYFNGELPHVTLTWSARKSKRILGHHDYVHDTIVISRLLDNPEVPELVLEFVLYHEMLHMKHAPKVVNGRRVYHSAAFRADERRFEHYDAVQAALDKLTSRK